MHRLALIVLSALIAANVSHAASGSAAAEFRGYVATNRALRERVLKPKIDFELGSYLGLKYDATTPNLLDLLGTYKSTTAGATFKNGKPNALNMLVWHLLLSEFAKDVSRLCRGERRQDFSDEFTVRVQSLCAWPDGGATSSQILHGFWLQIMGYNAPLSELQAWERFMASREMLSFKGEEAVEFATLSVLNNPYFLLRN